jgi:hypothetical protein
LGGGAGPNLKRVSTRPFHFRPFVVPACLQHCDPATLGLFRSHDSKCPHGVPPRGRRLDLWPEYGGAFPVWTAGGSSYSRDSLGLSASLGDDLQTWNDDWERAVADDYGRRRRTTVKVLDPVLGERLVPYAEWHDEWYQRGVRLAARLSAETGDHVVLGWAWGPDGWARDCVHCGERAHS